MKTANTKSVNDKRQAALNKLKQQNTVDSEEVLKALETYCEVIIKSILTSNE